MSADRLRAAAQKIRDTANAAVPEPTYDEELEWHEHIGIEVMHAMTCTHEGEDFGSKAVCVTCFANTQRIGAIVKRERDAARAKMWGSHIALWSPPVALDAADTLDAIADVTDKCGMIPDAAVRFADRILGGAS